MPMFSCWLSLLLHKWMQPKVISRFCSLHELSSITRGLVSSWSSQKEDPEGDRIVDTNITSLVGVWPPNEVPSAGPKSESETSTPPLPRHPVITLFFCHTGCYIYCFLSDWGISSWSQWINSKGRKISRWHPHLPSLWARRHGWVLSKSLLPNPNPWEKQKKKDKRPHLGKTRSGIER